MYVTKEQIRQARRAPLADYLLSQYPSEFKSSGQSIYQKNNTSLYIRKSVPGYNDFSTGEHGNSVDFLVRYKGLSFTEAVTELCRFNGNSVVSAESGSTQGFSLPPAAKPPFHRARDYLIGRCIPEDTVDGLISKGFVYQDFPYGNVIFVAPERDYCEIRGTGTQKFHGCRKLKTDRFWYCLSGTERPTVAYICESAIDAVSLMLIQRRQGNSSPAAYISIGGVANQQTIDRIKGRLPSVLAVDNDLAGNACRERNPELTALIPHGKDWNDDLCAMSSGV